MSVPAILASPDLGAPGVLGRQLLRLARAQVLPWATLITPQQWAALDAADLTQLLLTPPIRLVPGEQALQAAAMQALTTTGWQLLDAPRPWLCPAEAAWWDRLLELLASAPALIPPGLLAGLGRGLSPDDLPGNGLAALLAAELAAGTLWRRQFQGDALAAAAALPGVFGVLVTATEQGALPVTWSTRLLADTDPRQQVAVARAVLAQWPDPARWGDFLLALLQPVPAALRTDSADLAGPVHAALATLTLPRELDLLLALLALCRATDADPSAALPAGVWAQLAGLTGAADQHRLLDTLGGAAPGAPRLAALADAAGGLRLPWLGAHAPWLLHDPPLVARLGPETLAALAPRGADGDTRSQAFAALDAWMRRDPQRTAAALIAGDGWAAWRARAQPQASARRTLALLWLTHPAHARAVTPPAPATWQAVMADLGEGLDAETLRTLTTPAPRWPWLPGHTHRQISDLAARCTDLGALALLADVLTQDQGRPADAARGCDQRLLDAWPLTHGLSVNAFKWLCVGPPPRGAPTLGESSVLLTHAGERLALALRARCAAVIATLDQDPAAALAAADRPRLWTRAEFLAALTARLREVSADGTLPAWVTPLEAHLATSTPSAPPTPPATDAPWQHRLYQAGLHRLLSLLSANNPPG